ncbi:hypothetical protein MMC06_001001 [Schaereria dolodes]|nr:hypothetical protein [Schaereria dolodes]
MGEKNMVFSKDGLKVGVKELRNENYVESTQSKGVELLDVAGLQESVLEQGRGAESAAETTVSVLDRSLSEDGRTDHTDVFG